MISNADFKKDLAIVLPPERGGVKRPTEPIRTDIEFSTELPQLIAGDPALYIIFNYIFMQLLSNDNSNKQENDNLFNKISEQDFRIATESLKGLMSPEMLEKLNGIQESATNYTHPATHPATMIVLDALHRFVTDAQVNSWDSKANGSHGTHVPTPQTADDAKYLRNDNTWQTVTPGDIGAYTKDETYSKAEVNNSLSAKAPTVSPTFTGTVTAPTLTVTSKLNIPGGSMWIA